MEQPGLIIWKTRRTTLGHCPTRRTCPAVWTPIRGKGQDGGWGWPHGDPQGSRTGPFLRALRTWNRGTHPRALHGSALKHSPSCWTFLSKSGFGAQQTWAISACSGRCCWGKGLWEWGAEGAPEGGPRVFSG